MRFQEVMRVFPLNYKDVSKIGALREPPEAS